jgi:hypothetical protein
VVNRLVLVHDHIALAQRTLRLGPTQDLLVDLIAGHHRSETALVPRLGADLAPTLGLGRARPTPGTVAGRRLGGGARIKLDLLFKHQQPLPQRLPQFPLITDDRVTRLNRRWQGRLLGQEAGRELHSENFSGKSGSFCCGYRGGLNSYPGEGLPFPLTQQHLADALGLSLAHTNKTLRKLQRRNMFRMAGAAAAIDGRHVFGAIGRPVRRGRPPARPLI